MKANIVLSIFFLFIFISVNAQFIDDMESYTDGSPIITGDGTTAGDWTDWGCGGDSGCAIMSSSNQAHSGTLSGLIPNDGTTDAVLSLGNKIFGEWGIEFYMYVPSNQEGYWSIKSCVPICTQDWDIHFFFNQDLNSPGEGKIINSTTEDIFFNFPHDEWFRIVIFWDIYSGIELATWKMSIANEMVIPINSPFTNAIGEIPASLGGFNFFSISTNNLYYLDNFTMIDNDIDIDIILSISDFKTKDFKAYPNPVRDVLTLTANEEILSIIITNILGQEIYNQNIDALSTTIDMSSFSKGTYFVKAIIGDSTGTLKIIK